MVHTAFRTLVFYLLLLAVLRLMGKREIGSLSPFDLAITIMIAELAALPMENHDLPISHAVVPIVTLAVAEIVFSFISLKFYRIRRFINGTPSMVIRDGVILETEMRRLRYSLTDLLSQLRLKGFPNISDVEVAILETNGELSVIPKSQKRPLTPADMGVDTEFEGLPLVLIADGEVNYQNLKEASLDLTWLQRELRSRGITRVGDVLFASLETSGNLYIQRKNQVSGGQSQE